MPGTELTTRIKTALLLAFPLAVVLVASNASVHARMLLFGIGYVLLGTAAFEFARVCNTKERDLLRTAIYFIIALTTPTIALFLGFYTANYQNDLLLFCITPGLLYGVFLSFLIFAVYMFVIGRDAAIAPRLLAQDVFIGMILIGLCGACLISLATLSSGIPVIAWLLAVVIANDVGAYFIGKAIGGIKLAPYLSPKKTVSGSVGGLVAGVIVAVALSALLPGESYWLKSVSLAVQVGIAAQCGDLVKSYVKRLHDVKDMGTILPGHGGVLDRIDGLLCAAPIVFFMLTLSSV